MTLQTTLRTNEQIRIAKELNKELKAKELGFVRIINISKFSRLVLVKYLTINDETKRLNQEFTQEIKRLDEELDRKIEEFNNKSL